MKASRAGARRGFGLRLAIATSLVVAGISAVACSRAKSPADLRAYGAQPKVTVSGLSAGGYMAGQLQVAHSARITGAGIVAGGPWGCAESLFADQMPGPGTTLLNLSKAINGCMSNSLQQFGLPDPPRLAARARKLADAGRIDAVAELARHRVYLFSGQADKTIVPAIVRAAANFYRSAGIADAQVHLEAGYSAGHAWVTAAAPENCDETREPYIVACGFDLTGALLSHLLGPLRRRAASATGDLVEFSQESFTRDLVDHGLDTVGYVYVPKPCAAGGCRVHVFFHGCRQGRERIADQLVRQSGFLEWADGNDLIVLFPQVAASPVNPNGCWDWWGYTGADYLTRDAPQIKAVRAMLDRIATRRAAS